jgi:hypothetical protein
MTVAPIMEPDADAIRRHLATVFAGAEGLVELSWTDARTGALACAELFDAGDLEALAMRAVAINRQPGCNVYVGAALRRSDAARGRRARDEDFATAPCAWADVDADVVGAAVARAKAACLPPTMTVVTGRHPHLRAQMWWRLEEPCRDAAELRILNGALASALGGDPTVVNPSRVLRLGGSVAWPTKPGRVLERTEVHIPQDGRPRAYAAGSIGAALAPVSLLTHAPPANDSVSPQERDPRSSQPRPKPTRPNRVDLAIGSVSVESALAAARRGDRWHDHVVRLVGHWIARGWSDAEILGQAAGLTLSGYTVPDTLRDLNRMVAGARVKWNAPNPSHAVGDKAPPPPMSIAWEDGAAAAMIPRRRWLVGSFAIRGQLTVLVAPPGAGKSTLGIALGVAAATGRDELVGEPVHESVKAWIWNNEDDRHELKRRLAAVMQHWRVTPADLRGRLALNSGSERPLLAARAGKDGVVQRLPDVDAVAEIVRREGIGLLIVDPFVETHAVDENDNAQVKAVAALWREVARRCDCAVVLVHHTGKPPAAAPDSWVGSLSASRGASSLGGVARIVRTLFSMSEKDAERIGIPPEERHRWVRLDDAKANLALASGQARWFERVSVTIANGEEVGVLVPGDPAPASPQRASDETIEAALIEAIGEAWRAGHPFSDHPRAKERYAPAIVARALPCAQHAVEDVLVRLMTGGVIRRELVNPRTKSFGLRVTSLDERGPNHHDHEEA